MIIISISILLTVLGAMALYNAYSSQNPHFGVLSIAGYIFFIISFALLEFKLINISASGVFGLWAAGTVIVFLLYRIFNREEHTGFFNIFFSLVILIGLVGIIFG